MLVVCGQRVLQCLHDDGGFQCLHDDGRYNNTPNHCPHPCTHLLGLIQWPSQDDEILDVGALGEKGECNVHDILTNDKDGCLSLVQSKGDVTRINCHSQGHLRSRRESSVGKGDSSAEVSQV